MPRSPRLHLLLLVLLLCIPAAPRAFAAEENSAEKPIAGAPVASDGRQVTSQITSWSASLDKLEVTVRNPAADEQTILEARTQVEAIRDEAQALAASVNSSLAETRALLDALGPPPADENTKESPELARQRASLNAEISDLDGRAKRALVVAARADALVLIAVENTRKQVTAKVMAQGPSPFSLELWETGLPETLDAITALSGVPLAWWSAPETGAKLATAWPTVLLVIVGATIVGWPIRRWLLRKGGPKPEEEEPSQGRRVLAATAAGLATCAIPVLAIVSVYVSFSVHGLLTGDFSLLARGLVAGLSIYIVVSGFAHVALQPRLPQWRISGLSEKSAETLESRLKLLGVMIGVNSFIWIAFNLAQADGSFRALVNLFANSTIAFGLWPILGDRAWYRSEAMVSAEATGGETVDPRLYVFPRRVLRLLVLAIPVTALAGYYNLSDYITRNVILIGALFGIFSALTTVIGEATAAMLNAQRGPLRQVRSALGLSDDSGKVAHFWLAGFFNVALGFALFLAFLPSAGVPRQDIANFLESGISGVRIGNFTISFTDILLAIVVFIVALRLTRMVQRLLERRILPQTRFDTGVQNSIKSAAGYAGTTLGLVIAVSVAGINFSNIAIIAGALSVGIGFGLQNIVNNFISGLIVLVERPVKVGDWVVIGGAEGTVKRINVRATEIETFKRTTVIVPNGDLISQPIVNYTLHNKLGRIDIPVGVAYGSDPSTIEKTLIEIASSHKSVLSFPKPRVFFLNFGASSLDFELRCFLANIEEGALVRTDLMYAVERTFRERKIEIPFAQSEVNFKDRDFDRIEALINRFLDQRDAQRAEPAGKHEGTGNA
ncbi:mechanosensitive ion channel family protein [Zavarzinia compransoris]|nr:mechanosensitive ion channel domain-containing protein [Zavarzinia compransoris]TDP48973.1 small-conductance mechanosensitive channel [Zavarzinia compransoris]